MPDDGDMKGHLPGWKKSPGKPECQFRTVREAEGYEL